MNLVKELGVDYMRERFNGCMFYDDQGMPCYVDSSTVWPRLRVKARSIRGTPESFELEERSFPEGFFKDLSIFQTPPLGWRMSADGTYLVHFRRNNKSYQRALATKVVQRTVAPSTSFLIDTENVDSMYFERPDTTVAMIMSPSYVTFREGIEKMKSGELFSFCVSPNLAVIPEVNDQQALLFNTTRVGTVTKKGAVRVEVPQVETLIQDSIK